MRKIKFSDMDEMKVVCPICKKLVYDGSKTEGIKACKHLQGWYTNVDSSLLFTSPQFKADMEAYCKINEDATETEYIDSILDTKGTRVILYDGGCIGGCINQKELVVFSTVARKKASAKVKKEICKSFYEECVKHDLTVNEVKALVKDMSDDSHKDVMAGIKAGKQRRRNEAARKAWVTRKANSTALPLKKTKRASRKTRVTA